MVLCLTVPVSHSGNRVSHRCDCGHQDDEEYHEKSSGNRNQNRCLPHPGTHLTHKGTPKGKPKGTYKGNHEATRPVGATLGSTLSGTVAGTFASTIVFSLPPLSSHAVTHFSPHVIVKSGLLNPEHFCLLVLPCVKVALHFQTSANAPSGLWARLPQAATVSANPTRRREQRLQPPAPPEASRGERSAWGALRVEAGPPPEPAWGRGLPRRVWAAADTRGACCRARGRGWAEGTRVQRLGARREGAKRWPSLVVPGRWLSAASKQVGGHSARSKARPGREQQKLGRP